MKVQFGNPQPFSSLAEAISKYGPREFESPTRSTIPLLSLLHHSHDRLREIVRELGFPDDFDLLLEYTVPPRFGRGRASHTDAMLKSRNRMLAIEAKWTEPMYPTVGDWLKQGKNLANRQAVLEGWLNYLQPHTKKCKAEDFHDTIYQMLHRAASAATAPMPCLAYFLFKPSPDKQTPTSAALFEKLGDLWQRLGRPKTFPFYVVEIKIKALAPYLELRKLKKGNPATDEAIRAALQLPKPLFSVENYQCHRVS